MAVCGRAIDVSSTLASISMSFDVREMRALPLLCNIFSWGILLKSVGWGEVAGRMVVRKN
jgi:hypothetical protein